MEYFLTGSRVYGGATEKSDIDIVMMEDDARCLFENLKGAGLKPFRTTAQDGYDAGFYLELFGLKFNVIFAFDPVEYKGWKAATGKMLGQEPIENREKRVEVFQKYLTMFYDQVEEELP